MDIEKQFAYWTRGSAEDFAAAEALLEKGHTRHCLFFAHLALEKMLKALVTRQTGSVPPRIHNLIRLAWLAGLEPDAEQQKFLRRFDAHQLEGRYPDTQQVVISGELARRELQEATETLRWLRAQLSAR
jgi:HEPN domain-containing protein